MSITINDLFGTLQQSVVVIWRKHLATKKYSKHMALNEFYDEMLELVDSLVEAYQAEHDIVGDCRSVLSDDVDALTYLKKLKELCKDNVDLLEGNSDLESLMDDIINQINSTIYKVSKLTESKTMYISLTEHLRANLITESADYASRTLRKMMDAEGLAKVKIDKKGNNYKLVSDDPQWSNLLKKNDFNSISKSEWENGNEDDQLEMVKQILATIN